MQNVGADFKNNFYGNMLGIIFGQTLVIYYSRSFGFSPKL